MPYWLECKMVQPHWETVWKSLKYVKLRVKHITQQFHLLIHTQENCNHTSAQKLLHKC